LERCIAGRIGAAAYSDPTVADLLLTAADVTFADDLTGRTITAADISNFSFVADGGGGK
jgi:hypothetical protein